MKIYFSPEYSGTVYIGLSVDDNSHMDATIVDTAGHVGLLELRVHSHPPLQWEWGWTRPATNSRGELRSCAR